ncbi:MAG: GNAT family N-acetyltransferase [Gammaproteobacteria bacterium]|jgi:predicted GNAT family N-acyltransferase
MAKYQIIEAKWDKHEEVLKHIRRRVFVEEQQIPTDIEFDAEDEQATHLVAVDDARNCVGAARLLPSGQIGRMAVLSPHRGNGVGRMLLDAALERARADGQYGVFVHSPETVSAFFEKAGFIAVGTPFDESGTPHVKMTQELGVEFVPPEVNVRPVLNEVRETSPDVGSDAPPKGMIKIESVAECRDQVIEMTKYARRCVRIYSQELDPHLFDHSELAEILSEFARLSDHSEVLIMIHSSDRMVKTGHRLMTLMTRIPSKVHIRLVPEEQLEDERTFVVVDDHSTLLLSKSHQCVGFADYGNRPLTKQFADEFERHWKQSREDTYLRSIAMAG